MKHITVLIMVLMLLSCNDLPIGEDQLYVRGDFNVLEVDMIRINTLTEYDIYANHGSASTMVVGKNADYESRILLSFDFPDTTYEGLDEIKLILEQNTNFHNDTMKFNIHLLSEEFDEAYASWYQRIDLEYWQTPGGDFIADSVCIVQAAADSLVISFNHEQLEDMMAAPGIILIPKDTGFVHIYSGPQFILVKNDQTVYVDNEQDCHIVTGPEPASIENWIGGGVPYRNYAKFVFDQPISDSTEILPVYAELSFEAEKIFAMNDQVQIEILELLEPLDDFHTSVRDLNVITVVDTTDSIFTVDILDHIEKIIVYPDSNFGFFITLSPEYLIANVKIKSGSHSLKVGLVDTPQER
jgi:hypothetical protein